MGQKYLDLKSIILVFKDGSMESFHPKETVLHVETTTGPRTFPPGKKDYVVHELRWNGGSITPLFERRRIR